MTAGAKVAVTVTSAVSVSMQGAVPAQPPPLQPVNTEPEAAVAVKVTIEPLAKAAEHVGPQAIPGGALVTVPVPVPAFTTVRVRSTSENVAMTGLTSVPAVAVTVQAPVPPQPLPLHPLKAEFGFAVAASVTAVPAAKDAAHVVPTPVPRDSSGRQSIPGGVLTTDEAAPLPANATATKLVAPYRSVTGVSASVRYGTDPGAAQYATVPTRGHCPALNPIQRPR